MDVKLLGVIHKPIVRSGVTTDLDVLVTLLIGCPLAVGLIWMVREG